MRTLRELIAYEPIELKLFADTAHAEAIREKISPTNSGMWRSICRAYSTKYATPLHEVLQMDPEFIFQHHYETELEAVDLEDNIEAFQRMLRMIEDPNFVQEEQEELEDFVKMAEEQENERIRDNKPIHRAMKNNAHLSHMETSLPKPELPKEGFIDFSKLNQSEET